jgi:hypothetical protein
MSSGQPDDSRARLSDRNGGSGPLTPCPLLGRRTSQRNKRYGAACAGNGGAQEERSHRQLHADENAADYRPEDRSDPTDSQCPAGATRAYEGRINCPSQSVEANLAT